MSFLSPSSKAIAFLASAALAAAALVSCGVKPSESFSDVNTVNLPHTSVKWQSIGNCWAYSFTSWLESMVLTSSDGAQSLNISESFITYVHYRSQLLSRSTRLTSVQTGGWFETAAALTLKHGYMLEGEFIPEESEQTFSARQQVATAYLDESLKNGLLKTDRSPATVKAELNAAFGIDIDALAPNLKSASDLTVRLPGSAGITTLARLIDPASRDGWRAARWVKDSPTPVGGTTFPYWAGKQSAAQSALLKRVKKALNAGYPVVIDWFVDFNALNGKGEFSGKQLELKGPGRQGLHSTVIEDYVVEGVNPATGEKFVVGEGEATPEEKKLAEEFGEITYFVVKNSWGGSERLDRVSYVRDGEGGYHKLDADYIFSWIKQVDEDGNDDGIDTGLTRFVLPAGY
jgi:hypothetical protein